MVPSGGSFVFKVFSPPIQALLQELLNTAPRLWTPHYLLRYLFPAPPHDASSFLVLALTLEYVALHHGLFWLLLRGTLRDFMTFVCLMI